jgi:Golgi apparatus protein 1
MTRVAGIQTVVASATVATTLLLLAPSSCLAEGIRDRLAAAIETVERSCGEDVNAYCGKVTRGEGRLLLCMQAHEDQLSRKCQLSLYRASRRLENALHRVERTADACWSDIEAQCANADRIGQCVAEKRGSLSAACQTVIAAIQKAVQGVAGLRGTSVFSSDDKNLGHIMDVKRGVDGRIQSIEVEVGRFLGLGSKVVEISGDKLEEVAEKVRLRIGGDEVRSLPLAVKQ